MDTHRTGYRLMASILVWTLTLQPMVASAGITIDNSQGGNTTLTPAGNGVPVINIATPNNQGLSHNRFTDFNVDTNGLVLNNSLDKLSQSQLAGFLQNNTNLNGAAANLILNEVNGGSPSQLKGYTEVFGQQAGVIVANPYGITCNGCGFINTPRATLSTGSPQINEGSLTGFSVDGGSVAIEGLGLNASNIDQFDIITRSLSLNAELNAQRLNLVLGRNEVDYPTLSATAKTKADDQPDFALDASALGSMYANSIYLVGTEHGVGVRSAANMAASGGDITLDVNGNIQLKNTAASQDVQLTSTADIALSGNTRAANQLSINANGQLSQEGVASAGERVVVDVERLQQNGLLAAGVDNEGNLKATGELNVKASSVTNTGTLQSAQSLIVDAGELNNQQARILSGSNASITAGNLNNQGGVLSASNDLTIVATGTVDNQAAADQAGIINTQPGNLSIQAGSVVNTGSHLQSGATTTITTGTLENENGTVLGDSVVLTADRLTNKKGAIQGSSANLTVRDLDNDQGQILATTSDLSITARTQLSNQQGLISAQQKLILDSDEIINDNGELLAGELEAKAGEFSNHNGLVEVDNHAHITASELDNTSGSLRILGHTGDSTIASTGQLLNNQGVIETNNPKLVLKAGELVNQNGRITHTGIGILSLQALRFNNSQGLLRSNSAFIASDIQLNNQGGTLSTQRLDITGNTSLDNSQGVLEADVLALDIDGNLINDDGRITQFSTENQTLHANRVQNHGRGRIESNAEHLRVETETLSNQGVLAHSGTGQFTGASTSLINSGKLLTSANMNLLAGDIDNTRGSLIGRNVQANVSGTLSNSTGLIEASESLTLTGRSGLDNTGGRIKVLSAHGETRLSTDGLLTNSQGVIELNSQQLSINAHRLLNDSGMIHQAGSGAAALNVTQDFSNRQGNILTKAALELNAGHFDNHSGKVYSTGGMNFALSGLNNAGGLIHNNHDSELALSFAGSALDNTGGQLVSRKALSIDTAGLFNAGGLVQAGSVLTLKLPTYTNAADSELRFNDSFTLNTGHFINYGRLTTNADLSLNLDGALTNHSLISSLGSMALQATELTNEIGAKITAGTHANIDVRGNLTNRGQLTSGQNMTVSAENINNAGTLGAGGDLTLTTPGTLSNTNGEAGSLIFSAGQMQLYASQLFNRYSDIYSIGDFHFALNDRSGLANTLTNRSGTIESEGDVSLLVKTLENRKDEFVVQERQTSGKITVRCTDCGGTNRNGDATLQEVFVEEVVKDSPMAQLVAGRDLSVTGVSLSNRQSLISANENLTMNLESFENQGQGFRERTLYREFDIGRKKKSRYRGDLRDLNTYNTRNSKTRVNQSGDQLLDSGATNTRYNPGNLVSPPGWLLTGGRKGKEHISRERTVYRETGKGSKAVVQAGQTVLINASQKIENGDIRQNTDTGTPSGKSIDTTSTGQTTNDVSEQTIDQTTAGNENDLTPGSKTVVTINSNPQADGGFAVVDPVESGSFVLPEGDYGLFVRNNNPDHPYLIETNPAFADFGTFISSDYMLGQLGYSDDITTRRLGDGFYEQRLIRQAIIEQTGQRYLSSSLASDYDQYRYLMDNGIAAQSELNLTSGIALTAEQVAALTHDIVWLEERVVAGQRVLVPILYLARTRPTSIQSNGALIAGSSVNLISGGALENEGTLAAFDNLTIKSAGDFTNSGISRAGRQLVATAEGSIINRHGGL
ncbi:filamentous hemagglutinin N-terminal domain-containing protein, partial [Endozoicomonas acroporae]|uniref:two-partner secretion domain-containing protein n=1 Tax=Endozoicomonas acroporae TaxID=1701104 RepID=UPI003D7B67AC